MVSIEIVQVATLADLIDLKDRDSRGLATQAREYDVPVRGSAVIHAKNVQIDGGNLTSVGRDVNHHTHFHEAPKAQDARVSLMAALESIDNFRGIQQDTLNKATPKTGEWIFEYNAFTIWRNPESNVKTMWGSGIPGAGKTVLTSIVISGVEKSAERDELPICVAYIYIRYSDNARLTVRHCLEVLVKQTVEKHPGCHQLAEGVYAEHLRLKTRPTEAELLQLLKSFRTMVAAMFFFLDALDEAPVHIQFDLIKKLSSLNVKLFITSRPMTVLAARFPDSHCFSISAQERDIELLINQEIENSYDLGRILEEDDPSLRADVISSVKRNCGGMFLHASLQMVALRECTSVHDVKETLSNFPAQIQDVYFDTWNRINDQPPNKRLLAHHCLLWVLGAVRSLEVDELRYAVAISPQTHEFDSNRLVSGDALIAPCRGLLVVDEETRLVRLVHYTAKDTLEHLIHEHFMHPHSLLATVCIARLRGHGFQHWQHNSPVYLSNVLKAEPLLSYAYDMWPIHVRNALDDTPTATLIKQFIRGCHAFPARAYPYYLDQLGPLHLVALFDLPIALVGAFNTINEDPNPVTPKRETPLHVACSRNSLCTMKELLHLPAILVNATNKCGATALILASEGGNKAAVELLLTHAEIDVNWLHGWNEESALISAIRQGCTSVVKLLLTHSQTNVDLADKEGRTPLIWASKEAYTTSVDLLLAHPQIDVNLADKEGRTPLLWALMRAQTTTVQRLLSHPEIDVNLTVKRLLAPLLVWVANGHEATLKLLLAHSSVEVNSADEEGRTPLIWAAMRGQEGLLQPLLTNPQVEVNVSDKQGRTPLHWAVLEAHTAIVQILLAYQVDVNQVDKKGCTPLALASMKGYASIVKILLDHPEVDVNQADNSGCTPLLHALRGDIEYAVKVPLSDPEVEKEGRERPHTEYRVLRALEWLNIGPPPTVKILLAHHQVDVNQADTEGCTPLLCALLEGGTGAVEALLEHPMVDVNRTDNSGRTPLLCASLEGKTDIVKILLTHQQINVNQGDAEGRTPLLCASVEGKTDIVKILLTHQQINVNQADAEGHTPLLCALVEGETGVVKALLEHPMVDVNWTDNSGCTPLLCASLEGKTDIVKILLTHQQIDVNQGDAEGRTPLLCALFGGETDVVEALLEHPMIDVNRMDNSGCTPLLCALLEHKTDIVKILLTHHQINVNQGGRAPLLRALLVDWLQSSLRTNPKVQVQAQ